MDTAKKAGTMLRQRNFITDFSRNALYLIAVCMLLWLNVRTVQIGGVAALLAAVFLSLGVGYLSEQAVTDRKKAELLFLALCGVLFWGICSAWVYFVPYEMEGDQAIVWTAASLALKGDFIMYGQGGQMYIYPQQQGLAFLYELLFRLTGTTLPKQIGYVNALLAPVTLLAGYGCTKRAMGKRAAIRFLPLMMLCLPYIIYSPYVYGDIPSICFSFVLLWAIGKALDTKKAVYGVLAALSAAIGLLCRMNIWIFFIAVLIGLFYEALSAWNLKPLLLGVGVVLCAALAMGGVKQFNSVRSGYPVSKGMPSVLWMAMGLQYSEYGAGYYNNYSKEIFLQTAYDRELSSAIGIQEIKDRIKTFMAYPDQCAMFFEEKMSSQWAEPLFESVKFTGTFEENAEVPSLVAWLYRGEGETAVGKLCASLQFMVYLSAMAGVVVRYFQKRPLTEDIPLITFVGGFLFSVMWEAKARYMLPYYVLLLMYAAKGLTWVSGFLMEKIQRLRNDTSNIRKNRGE